MLVSLGMRINAIQVTRVELETNNKYNLNVAVEDVYFVQR